MGSRDAKAARGHAPPERGSLRDLLRREGVAERVVRLAEAGYANTTGGTLESISAAMICYAERMWESDGEGDHHMRPPTSMRTAVDALGDGVDVRTRHPVGSIDWSGDRVAVRSRNGACVVDCAACVIAVPISMLKRAAPSGEGIVFYPDVPAKRAAMEAIPFGNACKIHCRFRSRPWPSDCHAIVCADCPIPEIWMDDDTDVDEFYATGYLMAKAADAMRGVSAKDACAALARQLDEIFSSGAGDALVEGIVMDWSDVPFVRGLTESGP